ncbi:MAG TPA: VOC family protein [Mycobacteriales bacterium]|nr:VOC family protein [Mycobacteriales bacterium]
MTATNPVGRLDIVVYDCPDARALAGFYAALLGREVLDAADDWVTLSTDGAGGPKLAFQRVDGYQPPRWPSRRHPQQMHVDVQVSDLATAAQSALGLGARAVSEVFAADSTPWRVFVDPVGHPFCLVTEG